MTFPTAASSVYYNEDGEVLGWDTVSDDASEYDPYDYDGGDFPEDDEDEDEAMDEDEADTPYLYGGEDDWLDGYYED